MLHKVNYCIKKMTLSKWKKKKNIVINFGPFSKNDGQGPVVGSSCVSEKVTLSPKHDYYSFISKHIVIFREPASTAMYCRRGSGLQYRHPKVGSTAALPQVELV